MNKLMTHLEDQINHDPNGLFYFTFFKYFGINY